MIEAALGDDVVERRRAVEVLIAAYWKPVCGYVRLKWRRSDEDAQDLTQGFFTRALENGFFQSYDSEKAAFRTWLRVCLDGFVANELQSGRRLKRGGGMAVEPLDAESALSDGTSLGTSLEDYFYKEWVRSVFELAVNELRQSCDARGKQVQMRLFERYDLEEEKTTYQQVAAEFGLAATDITNYLAWTRREFRRIVLEKLRELTANDREFRAEARALLGVVIE